MTATQYYAVIRASVQDDAKRNLRALKKLEFDDISISVAITEALMDIAFNTGSSEVLFESVVDVPVYYYTGLRKLVIGYLFDFEGNFHIRNQANIDDAGTAVQMWNLGEPYKKMGESYIDQGRSEIMRTKERRNVESILGGPALGTSSIYAKIADMPYNNLNNSANIR